MPWSAAISGILRAGPERLSQLHAVEEVAQRQQHGEGAGNHDQPLPADRGIAHVGGAHVGCRDALGDADTPNLPREHLQDEGKPRGRHESGEDVLPRRPEDQALHHHPEEGDDRDREHDRERKGQADERVEHVDAVGADHEELAVGEVRHLHDAEGEREADRDERVDRRRHHGVQQRLDQGGGVHATRFPATVPDVSRGPVVRALSPSQEGRGGRSSRGIARPLRMPTGADPTSGHAHARGR